MDYYFFLFIIIAIIGIYLLIKILNKINYDLKRFEILIYQIAFMLMFHVGKYFQIEFYQNYIGIFLFMIVAVYYYLKSIKTRKYIDTVSVIFLLLSILINYLSIKYIPNSINNTFYIVSGITILVIISIDFMVLFGMKSNLNVEKKEKQNTALLVFLSLITFINLIYGVAGNFLLEKKAKDIAIEHLESKYSKVTKYELMPEETSCHSSRCNFKFKTNNKYEYYSVSVNKSTLKASSEFKHCLTRSECEAKSIEVAEQYLVKKYGNFNYTLNKEETECSSYSCDIYFDTGYISEPFSVEVDREDYIVDKDDFLLLYFSDLLNDDFYSYYQLEESLIEQLEEKVEMEIRNKYNIDVIFKYSTFEEDLSKMYFGKIPTIDDFKKYVSLKIMEVNINKVYTPDQIELFKQDIISFYEDLPNYGIELSGSKILYFNFAYDNPFNTSGSISYKDSGYIRDSGSRYLIYTQPTPYEVQK